MLQIVIESNYYQNNEKRNNLEKSDNRQTIGDDTKQKITESSSMKKIYQNQTNKIQPLKEKIWTIPIL